MTWTKPDPDNPPHHTMVGLYDDGCSSIVITKTDQGWHYAEDGQDFDWFHELSFWTPAPADFRPRFMEITDADWY